LVIETVAVPEPGPGQVLVKVDRCGICGSDLHITEGKGYTVPDGSILGHEFAGEVVEIGKGAERLRVGDRAAAMPIFGCGKCRFCQEGRPAWCVNVGYTFGGYGEYALMNDFTAVKLPASLSSADGALAEPLAVALHGLAVSGIAPGSRVLVLGAGPIGLAALFWARRMGAARVDVVEGAASRATIAKSMGADSVSAPGQTPESETGAPEIVIECVGRTGLLGQALDRVARGGTIVSLGYCFLPDALVPAAAGGKEVTILFPQLYSTREFELAVDVLDRGAAEPKYMVTRTVGYEALPSVFDSLRKSPIDCKVLINPQQATL
jgi:(R,R)-butanediol dehydrogenase/meso-butanediol dehydrogenase/diacetyl reductase